VLFQKEEYSFRNFVSLLKGNFSKENDTWEVFMQHEEKPSLLQIIK